MFLIACLTVAIASTPCLSRPHAQPFTALLGSHRLIAELDRRLDSGRSEERAQAVIALQATGIKSDKTLRALVEMLALDSSDYVRLQVRVSPSP